LNIKSVIFDLDGTLIDSIQDIADCTNRMLKNNGFDTHPLESYVKWIGNGARILIEKAVPTDTESKIIDKLLSDYIELYTVNYNIKTCVYEGLEDVLNFLEKQKLSISIFTNKPHAETQKIAAFYLNKWDFKFIYGQRNNVPKKPDPKVALEIANELNIQPSEIVFIGDSSTDIKTAKAADMIPVGVTWGYGTKESMQDAGCKIFAHNPTELIEIVKKIS
jgi:phosphoglycolate phosphatase